MSGKFNKKPNADPEQTPTPRQMPKWVIPAAAGAAAVILIAVVAAMIVNRPGSKEDASSATESAVMQTVPEETVPPPAIQGNGDAASVACKASYVSKAAAADDIVATAGSAQLTNAQLQVRYQMELAQYMQSDAAEKPDLNRPLDSQICPLNTSLSWQHYFLQKAVENWSVQQALILKSREPQPIIEEKYLPNAERHEKYLAPDLPLWDFLYCDKDQFTPNELHQAYLESLTDVIGTPDCAPGTTVQDYLDFASDYNFSYFYFTELRYSIAPTAEEVEEYRQAHAGQFPKGETVVDLRHTLLTPENAQIAADGTVTADDADWDKLRLQAEQMLDIWRRNWMTPRTPEASFARVCNENSMDLGSRLDGGLYVDICPGQLIKELDAWCFDPARQNGDTTFLRSDLGYHLVYMVNTRDSGYDEAEAALTLELTKQLLEPIRKAYPLKADYSKAVLTCEIPDLTLTPGDILYPDVAHQRFPSAITFLQQDYPESQYGRRTVAKGGCGITTMAMLATYMSDTLHTPGELAERYPEYSVAEGTNGDIFRYVPAELGFYLEGQLYSWESMVEALRQGHVLITLQQKGHFTSAGHYLLLTKYNEEDETVVVRDSNIFNYGKLEGHKIDRFTKYNILSGQAVCWVMQPKITRLPACSRCGIDMAEKPPQKLLNGEYTCEKCAVALARRNDFLTLCSN